MCFSAEASFGTGVMLTIASFVTIKKTKTKSQIFFAIIPLIFGIQQITEGFLWIALANAKFEHWQSMATNIFLIFAQVIWPTWVPLSILLLEKETKRKKLLSVLLSLGILVSICLAINIFKQNVKAEIINHHIYYGIDLSEPLVYFFGSFYFMATVISPFVSSIKKMQYLGLSILISYIITKLFFETFMISVWCFFAALISITIYSIVIDFQKPSLEKKIDFRAIEPWLNKT